MKHIVMFSGGSGSWAAAKRVAESHGTDDLILLFTDTKMEDEDLYRFLDEAAANIGGQLVKIADGRDPWQLFFDVKMMGNTRVDPCSLHLKRNLARFWVEEHYKPSECILYVGIDWTEIHRMEAVERRWQPYHVEAPLCDKPLISKCDILADMQKQGIKPPRLYEMGFVHNNCGGFCVKAGITQFVQLLRTMPERYAYHESKEEEFREFIGKDVSIMRDRSGGEVKSLTMKRLREKVENGYQAPRDEWGGCGCFVSD